MASRPIGLSRDLPAKRVMRAFVDGDDLAVWRASDGTIAAWDNRCPHRGMALSHGFVRGNSLACLYHGWHYDASGRCSYIPAHPDLEPPATIHTVSHSVTEVDGVIWVSLDAEATGEAHGLAPLRSFIADASQARVHAACAQTALDGQVPQDMGNGRFTLGDETMAVLCNPLEAHTQVTALVPPGLSVSRRMRLSRWCEAMRRTAENEDQP